MDYSVAVSDESKQRQRTRRRRRRREMAATAAAAAAQEWKVSKMNAYVGTRTYVHAAINKCN